MKAFLTAWLLAAFGLLAACANDKKDLPKEGNERAERFQALKAKFEDENKELMKKFKMADPEDRPKIRTEGKELYVISAGKAVAIAAENPKDEVALDACVFALERLLGFQVMNDDTTKAIQILTEHHLDSPKLKKLVTMVGPAGEAGEKFLKAVAEKATDKEVKGLALYTLGSNLAEQIDDTEDETKAKAMTEEAIGYLEKAIKVAGDVKFRDETLAKAAEEDLFALKHLAVGKPIPDVGGTDLHSGEKKKLSSFKGKVVLLDIWATWCGPCKAMIPHEREMVKNLAGKPFELISVSADTEKKTLEEFIKDTPMPWKHWWDGPDAGVIKTFRVKAFPTLYLIDAKGIIRKKFIGSPGNAVLDKAVEEVMKEAEKK